MPPRFPQFHDLKLWPAQFKAVQQLKKTFDLRVDNRNYQVDDRIRYREFDPDSKEYTGATQVVVITYITRNAVKHGLNPHHAILGIQTEPQS